MRIRCLALVCLATVLANAQELNLPGGPVTRLASPDSSKILYGGAQLWIQDVRTQRRTKLLDIGSTLSAAWSEDGSAFYVNDRRASDSERAYIFDAATLKRVDLAARILAEDPVSRRFANDHAYFELTSWDGPQNAAVSFFGHTSGPVTCFTFRYRISGAGVVTKVSQHTSRATTEFCRDSP